MTMIDGSQSDVDAKAMLDPLEGALRVFSWAVVVLSLGLLLSRLAA